MCKEHCCCEKNNNSHKHNHCCDNDCEIHKSKIIYILLSLIIFIIAIVLPIIKNYIFNITIFTKFNIETLQMILYIIAYLIIGIDVIKVAIKNIFKGKIFDENFLMALATVAAFITHEYPEAVMVMWLYQVGEMFQHYAVGKSRKSITKLMDIRPDYANIEKDGEIVQEEPNKINVGDIIIVKPGEKIPLDGNILDGESLLDTMALTGEAIPKKVRKGMEVYSGCINKTGVLKIKVTKLFNESTVSKILELVEHASNRKAKAENFISKFAKYYTPIVVIIAVILAIVPPFLIENATFSEYIHRACAFLVISCPCALVISIPLVFFAGIGGASKVGVLIKGSNYLEALAKTKVIAFDKTGTLTKGNFVVNKINSTRVSESELLEIAALAEAYSEHPIANSIKLAYRKEIDFKRVSEIKEISGRGIKAKVDGNEVYVGNRKLMDDMQIKCDLIEKYIATIVYVATKNEYLGYIVIADEIKDEAKDTIIKLKQENKVEKIVMLTGDNLEVAKKIGEELSIDEVYAELLPNNKVEQIEKILLNKKNNDILVFVGDGINDAPVLTRADVGIAMGGLGADAAIEAADIVIMDDNISNINMAIKLSKKTLRIVKQNIIFAIAIKLIVLLLGAFGITNMWQAVFADVGVSFISILNAMRALKIKK